MMFVVFTLVFIVAIGAEETQNEITSNNIMETSSTEKAIEPLEFTGKAVMLPRSSTGSPRSRRGRYLRQAPRMRRRPPFDYPGHRMRRPPNLLGNNFPNLYGPPRTRFHPSSGPYRPGPYKSRYRYRDWRHKWPESNQPFYNEDEEMDVEPPPYDEYDDTDEFANSDDPWYSKKYRENFEDVMPVGSKYNEKRSPARYYDFPRSKIRGGNYEMYKELKDPMEWQERNRFTKNYRDFVESMTSGKKYITDDEMIANHRFRFSQPNRFRTFEDEEYFSGLTNPKSRKSLSRRPTTDENKVVDMSDVTKYITSLNSQQPSKETVHEPVYSAKYRGREPYKEEEDKSKKVEENHNIENVEHDWKRTQKPSEFQFASMNKPTNEFGRGGTEETSAGGRNMNYKEDRLLPSELIAYMSADPAESAVVGKEERFLQASYPFVGRLSDHDMLKMTYPRKISPIIEQDLEITFDERSMADWKH